MFMGMVEEQLVQLTAILLSLLNVHSKQTSSWINRSDVMSTSNTLKGTVLKACACCLCTSG